MNQSMKHDRFDESNYPYETLEKFGLTREMIEDLPMNVLDDLSMGYRSPVLPIKVTDEKGEVVSGRSRFAFIPSDNGGIDVLFYPALKNAPIEQFNEHQQTLLKEGKVIIAEVTLPEGQKTNAFVQVDAVTHQVLTAPISIIESNLKVLADAAHLGSTELKSVQNGKPLTFILEDEPITIGIDLTDKVGVRICEGDEQIWSEQSKKEWSKYTFGCYGCWVTDNEGNHDYIPEESYTDEIWDEQRKAGLRNMSSSIHK